jgi:hypothetical protein
MCAVFYGEGTVEGETELQIETYMLRPALRCDSKAQIETWAKTIIMLLVSEH